LKEDVKSSCHTTYTWVHPLKGMNIPYVKLPESETNPGCSDYAVIAFMAQN